MKKVIVVCRAGPRSNKWPWPIPSSCQRNSLSPLDWRPLFCAAPGVAGIAPLLATATALAGWIFPGGESLPGIGETWPGRDLLKKFILVPVLSACLHGHHLRRCRGATGRLCQGAIVLRVFHAGDLHLAVNLRTFSNGDPRCGDIATDFPRGSNLHPLPATQCSRHFSSDDNLAGINVRGNFAVRADGDAAIGEMDGALHLAVDIQVIAAPNFALYQ